MSHILIIGYGNPLRGDDGFGWYLAQRLQSSLDDPDIEIVACHQLTPELAEPISRARHLIFADASAEATTGDLVWREIQAANTLTNDFSHYVTPQSLLMLARTLYEMKPRAAFLITASAREFGYGERLSPQMKGALDQACALVMAQCDAWTRSRSHRAVGTL